MKKIKIRWEVPIWTLVTLFTGAFVYLVIDERASTCGKALFERWDLATKIAHDLEGSYAECIFESIRRDFNGI